MASAETIQRASDELEIRTVIARLAQLADWGDLDDYVAHFTEDASWEVAPRESGATAGQLVWEQAAREPARRGHAAILAGARERRAAGFQGPNTNSHHIT